MGNAQDFVGTIGHEFKNPLNSIRDDTRALKRAFDYIIEKKPKVKNIIYEEFSLINNNQAAYADIEMSEYLDKKFKNIDGLVKSTDNILAVASLLAQISHNSIELTFKPVNLYRLAKIVAQKIKREIGELQGERNLKVIFDFNARFKKLDRLVCDRFIVEKIIENIFRNALKYSTPPGYGKPIIINVHANPSTGLIYQYFSF